MIVRELIASLLDYDMDSTVEILVKSDEDSFDTNDFEIVENKFSFSSYITLKVVPDGHVVVDEASYEDLKQEKIESEELAERMSSFVEELEQKVNEMELN
ncbi:MAG: hypothetical protein ABS938_11580 [Psychrobacillus psychrodurans]